MISTGTGSLSAALTAGVISGVTAGLFNAAGTAFSGNSAWQITERTVAHAAIGCASAAASSGNCGTGALAAAVTEAANSTVMKGNEFAQWGHDGQLAARTALSGLIGGAADRIVGGNFVEGFSISAAGYLYNSAWHSTSAVNFVDDNGVPVREPSGAIVQVPSDVDMHSFVAAGELFDQIGAPEQGLPNFARNGLWDIQRIDGVFYPAFRDAATVAIGLYAAAAGIPINQILAACRTDTFV